MRIELDIETEDFVDEISYSDFSEIINALGIDTYYDASNEFVEDTVKGLNKWGIQLMVKLFQNIVKTREIEDEY